MAIDTEPKMLDWLRRFGYVLNNHPTEREIANGITKMQRVYRLRPDGVAGPITRRAMSMFRCAAKDTNIVAARAETATADTPVVVGTTCRWKKKTVSYAISRDFDLRINKESCLTIIRSGFRIYEPLTGLTFSESNDFKSADIQILSGSGKSVGLDGAGNILALSSAPCGAADKQLKTIFDADEPWTLSSGGPGVVLVSVWMHELGHLVGLNHSADPRDLMSPYYTPEFLYPQRGDKQRLAGLYNVPYVETGDTQGRFSVGPYAVNGVLVIRHDGGMAINLKDISPV